MLNFWFSSVGSGAEELLERWDGWMEPQVALAGVYLVSFMAVGGVHTGWM